MNFQSKTMNLKKKNSIYYCTFKALDTENFKFINHAFSTKFGGISKNKFNSMNLSFKMGDQYENVLKNFDIFCKSIGFEKKNLVIADQTHSNNVKIVTNNDTVGNNLDSKRIKNTDGLITNQTGIVLMTSHADCNSLFFIDIKNKIIGLAHAGWRGTVSKIAEKMALSFIKKFNTNPENLICCMGPAIQKCCFKIHNDILPEFLKIDLPNIKDFIVKNAQNDSFNVDLLGINKQILINLNIPVKNIHISDLCTKCHSELFYSHRASGLKRGSMAAFLSLT